MRDPVAFLLFISLLAIVFPKSNGSYNQENYELVEYIIRDDFDAFDLNKDDYLDTEEMSIYRLPADVESVFNRFDADGDGKMNYEEFTEQFMEDIFS